MGINLGTATAYLLLDKKGFDSGLSSAGKSLNKFADDAEGSSTKSGKLGSSMGKLGSAALKLGGTAVTAAAAAVGMLAKSAVQSYAEYEQLVGGVETLFKDSQDTVMKYAENAYKTAGLSANEYMTTVTSFSASLLQSLGGDTEAAAKSADQAITDMSDNANKMGTDMSLIQSAYQGFAKQNYTMLDNLKLGYGGTKEEMQRLLTDAEKLSGVKYDMSNLDDVYSAIHVVQTELGITGTTAKEASTTIQGSLAMTKSAWENLVAGLADKNADIPQLIDNLVSSVTTAAANLIPVIEQTLTGIGAMIEQLAPIVAQKVPALIAQVLPTLVNAALQLVLGLVNGLIAVAPQLLTAAVQIIQTLATGLVEALPELIPALVNVEIMIVETLIDNIDMLVEAAIEIIMALAEGLIDSLPILLEKVPELVIKLVGALADNAYRLLEAAADLIIQLSAGLWNGFVDILGKIGGWVDENIAQPIRDKVKDFLNIGANIIGGLREGIRNAWDGFKTWVEGLWNGLSAGAKKILGIASPSKVFREIGQNIMKGLYLGMEDESGKVIDTMQGLVEQLAEKTNDAVKQFNNMQDVAQLRYELWSKQNTSASGLDKLTANEASLNKQLEAQKEKVKATEDTMYAMQSVYGENSAECVEWQKELLNEQIAYEELKEKIDAVIASKEKLSGTYNAAKSGGVVLGLPSFATGLDYVPYDNYAANLHKGERVLTADEASAYNSGAGLMDAASAIVNGVVNGISGVLGSSGDIVVPIVVEGQTLAKVTIDPLTALFAQRGTPIVK